MWRDFDAVIAFSAEFASDIVSRALGGSAASATTVRKLSDIELSICEFFAATAFSNFNGLLEGTDNLIVSEVANDAAAETLADTRVVEIVGDLIIGDVSGMISVLMPFGMLSGISRHLEKKSNSAGNRRLNVEHLSDFTGKLDLNIKVGKTVIQAVEIPFLEPEDVVLLTAPDERWFSGEIVGRTDSNV